MIPWTSEEHLISEKILEEAHSSFSSHFPHEAWFERTLHLSWQNALNCTFCHLSPKPQQTNILAAKRSDASLLAEAYLAKQLNWKLQLSPGYLPHHIKDLVEMCKKINAITNEKIWLETLPRSGGDIALLKEHLTGITIPLDTINKGIRKRLHPNMSIQDVLTTFDDAKHLRKGIALTLGIGENLNDIPELQHVIASNHIDKVILLPVLPHKNTQFKKSPSSFYMTRWIAETRIAFPKVEIVVGTWRGRVAEVGLFMKAGANAITKFPAVKRFNSEDAQSIEQEIKTANRHFISTITDVGKVAELRDTVTDPETKEKLLNYLHTIQEHK